MPTRHTPFHHQSAFTLVELLVVIGIIAVLISILLPSLQAARKSAESVKCESNLRQIGQAFQMYAIENKGWFPPSQLQANTANAYDIDGVKFRGSDGGDGAKWFNFIAKYVTKNKLGGAVKNVNQAQQQQNTVIWGCPAWQGYLLNSNPGGISTAQTGYGMNSFPTFRADYPKSLVANSPPIGPGQVKSGHPNTVFIQNWNTPAQVGDFVKQDVWGRRGAERCLVADSLFWEIVSNRVSPVTGPAGQLKLINNFTSAIAAAPGFTMFDCYRHGKYPPSATSMQFSPKGGKVGYNILYVDGHVAHATDRSEAFRSIRMRYPN